MITYTNRKGQKYILKTAETRTGKPRWYASMKAEKGKNAKAMPEGYDFYEDVNGQVFVRKPIKTNILPGEVDAVERACWDIKTDCKVVTGKKDLVVYRSEFDPSFLDWMCSEFGNVKREPGEKYMRDTADYSPSFRFALIDSKRRTFSVERMSYRGPEPHWYLLRIESELPAALKEYIPVLDDMEEFFELM